MPGKDSMTSPDLAQLINESSVQGISKFHFYIGDLESEEVKPFHVSSFTQSGSLTGTIILEQIYRAYRILNHQPYHK
ncbi:MAG: 23S rRNA (pseudouridine(1915)-N(3))-methyltransferase RlmH [Anaerostipes hadrus]